MKITNNSNLPRSLFDAICKVNAKYSKGNADYSTTQLIDSPRISQLRKQHWDEIEEDAGDMIWRFYGSLSHEIIANMEHWNVLNEERMYTELDGKVISGCPDLFDGTKVTDYKITFNAKGVKPEWEKQLNVYRYILCDNKWEPKELEIVAILRGAVRDDPKVVVLPVAMWDMARAEAYLRERIQKHIEASTTLPLCTEEERWYTERKFAVMKAGNKKATKVFGLKVEANLYMKVLQEKEKKVVYIEERPGESKRCKMYCNCVSFCSQYQEMSKPLTKPGV